jgi:DNA polymerase-1
MPPAALYCVEATKGTTVQIETAITVVDDARSLHDLELRLRETRLAGLDIETNALPWYDPDFRILNIGISPAEGEAYVFHAFHPENRDAPTYLTYLHWIITVFGPEEDVRWVMQNGAFDVMALRTLDIDISEWDDTLVAEYLIDVERKKGLQILAERYLGVDEWKDIDYSNPMEESLETLDLLVGHDADVTRRVWLVQRKQMSYEATELYTRLLMPLSLSLVNLEHQGLPVDRERLADELDNAEEELETVLDDLRSIAGQDKFNPNSFQQVGKLLYGKLGLPCMVWTDKGSPSTSAEALGKIETLHPVVPLLQKFRKVRKLVTASLRPWAEFASYDGRLHPRFKPAFVKTGRLSSEGPNVQQIPRGSIREIFGGVPGQKLVEIDYSQIELRVVAYLAGEETMLAAFRDGEDLHELTARDFGVDRQTAKALNFGLLYEAGPRTLMRIAKEQYGVELTEAQATTLRAKWYEKYEAIPVFHEACKKEARETGGITTVFGRWRPLPEIYSTDYAVQGHAERQAINTPVQSLASDITLWKLTQIEQRAERARPVATVHDSILFLIPEDNLETDVANLQQYMEDLSDIPFANLDGLLVKTEAKIGDYWS